MNEDQLVILKHIRNAVDDMFDKLHDTLKKSFYKI